MEDPKTIEELHDWVVKNLGEIRPDLTYIELDVIAEGLVKIVKDVKNIPAFLKAYEEDISKRWPLNKNGTVEKEED